MYKESTDKYIAETFSKLSEASISVYKISKILKEPESMMHRIFKSSDCKHSEKRVLIILDRINDYLNEIGNGAKKITWNMDNCATEDPELFIKLYALGLDSKAFTPDEKYKLAVAYKKLTDTQTK